MDKLCVGCAHIWSGVCDYEDAHIDCWVYIRRLQEEYKYEKEIDRLEHEHERK